MYAPAESAEVRRFSKRLVILEEPRIAERIQELAAQAGHSSSAEIRGAIRLWLRSCEGLGSSDD